MYAIVEVGGKQYRVNKDDVIQVEKLDMNIGDKVQLNVLSLVDGENAKFGNPYVEGAKVVAEVLEQGKQKKVVVYKYKAKKNVRRKNGHRQPYTALKIVTVE